MHSAEELDLSDKDMSREPRTAGAGGRHAAILKKHPPRNYMGRHRPLPGEQPRVYLHRVELEAIRTTLVTALQVIDEALRR